VVTALIYVGWAVVIIAILRSPRREKPVPTEIERDTIWKLFGIFR
jgi:hypothetical protein